MENPNKKILIVDDVAINRLLLKHYLTSLDYTSIDEAECGKEAIQMATENSYWIIFMDIMMPNINGTDAAKYILNTLKANTIIISLTALPSDLVESGVFHDHLRKPYTIDYLKSILDKHTI